MLTMRDTAQVLDREFLEIRTRILDVAAALDRLDRAPESPAHHHPDPRLAQISQALEVLLSPDADRAATVLHVFSLEYDPEWRARFDLPAPRA